MSKISNLEYYLKKYFKYDHFRTGQREIIIDTLQQKNVLGVLPTGSGKSICYQLPSLILDGLTIVVSPLISLMMDQVKELKAKNIKKVAALNSFVDFQERQNIYRYLHHYKLLYVSPELLQQEYVLERLSRVKISLFVIDEAHCISQWGHDFRPDYLKLATIIKHLQSPPVLALTATATPAVQEDIIRNLTTEKMVKHIYPMDRNNLTFIVENVSSDQEKLELLIYYLKKQYGPALIYFSSRVQAENLATILSEKIPELNIAYYHGGVEPIDRIQIQQQFMNGQIDIICCTSAFGMGINKPDIRLIIHYHLPAQMEAYIQEVGRAGRDGNPSICLLLYGVYDIAIPKNMIINELPQAPEIQMVLQHLRVMCDNSIQLGKQETELIELFQISEIKWRFLRFHFEKHGIIVDNKIYYHEELWQSVYQQLVDWIHQRSIHKNQELQEMIDWAESNTCLRENLYKKFQSGFEQPIFECCSNCGVKLENWKPMHGQRKVEEVLDWRFKLQKLLLGVEDETK